MASDPDAESRLNVDLMATKTESYDEVVAFTEQIINKNFATLFENYPEMTQVQRFVYGQPSIDATLHPSRIIIPTNSKLYGANTVLYQLR